MAFNVLDYILIALFFLFVIFIIFKGFRKDHTFPSFFNAGGKLTWLMIGVSILGTNIGFGYIMNSASNGYSAGLAYGSYEWTASFVMIIVALYFVPYFLRIGVLTLPEYLEYRFNRTCRIFMAGIFLVLQVGLIIPILISNGIFIEYFWGIPKIISLPFIALTGGAIVYSGGLASKVRLDLVVFFLFFASALVVLVLCLVDVKGISNLIDLADGRLEVALPETDKELPWTSVFLGGLWILHLQYWAFFQPMAQTVLASASLSQAQKGLLFAATAKLFTPILMIIPGIVGYEMYSSQFTTIEHILPVVIKNVVPYSMAGIIIIGYMSTMFSTFAGYAHATAAIFTNDLFQHLVPEGSKEKKLVKVAKASTVAFVMISVLSAYFIVPDGTLWKFTDILLLAFAPVSASVFLFALFSKRTPAKGAIVVMIVGIPVFFIFKEYLPFSAIDISGFTCLVMCGILMVFRVFFPLPVPVVMPEKFEVKFERNLLVEIWGIFIITAVFAIYALLI
jgi:solute:Na+ symporter, SSS family